MASKLLTGYKVIKGTKRTYKIGLKRAYNILSKYQEKLRAKGKLIESRAIPDFEAFRESYISKAYAGKELTQTQIKKIHISKSYIALKKSSFRYLSSAKGARSMIKQVKEMNEDIRERAKREKWTPERLKRNLVEEKSYVELRKMTTTDIAEFYKDEIKAKYKTLKGDSYEKQKQIAEMYFGS